MHARALAVVLVVAGFAACGAQERPAPPAPVAATPAPSASEARLAVLDGGDRGCATPTSYESGLQAEAQPTAEPDMGWASGEMHVKSSKDACGVADDNLEAAENAILAQAAPSGPPAASPAWDHKTPPLYLDRIDRRYRLTADEKRLLSSRGFVVSSRIEPRAYGWHLHEIFQSELPLYVSADSLFHAAYIGNDDVIRHVESEVLDSLLEHVLTKLACALPAAARGYHATRRATSTSTSRWPRRSCTASRTPPSSARTTTGWPISSRRPSRRAAWGKFRSSDVRG